METKNRIFLVELLKKKSVLVAESTSVVIREGKLLSKSMILAYSSWIQDGNVTGDPDIKTIFIDDR